MRTIIFSFLLYTACQGMFFLEAQEIRTTNLGSNVNSKYDELVPVISPDGKTIYFTRFNHPENFGGIAEHYDIWFSKRQSNGEWGKAQNIGHPLNDSDHNFLCSISPDGNTALVSGYYEKGERIGKGYSISRRELKGWSSPKGIRIKEYKSLDKGLYSNAWLASDQKTLLLSFSTKEEGENGDIYVSFQEKDGSWSRPKSLGNQVNTPQDEGTPFLAADGKTLYFSSNRPGGMGQNDIYVTRRRDDTWSQWSTPIPLQSPINTPQWDAYYTVPASGEDAYIVSYHGSEGKGDIHRVNLPEKFRPAPVVLIKGKVYDTKAQKPVGTTITYEILPEGKEAGLARSDPRDGSYTIVLPQGHLYGFSAESNDYFAEAENIDLRQTGPYKEIKQDLSLKSLETGTIIRLNNLFFEFSKATLTPASYSELGRLVQVLEKNPNMRIEIHGHTDNIGEPEDNLELSRNRAKACLEYLFSKGVERQRIEYKGYGENKPLLSNDTPEGRRKNRRVEFKIIR